MMAAYLRKIDLVPIEALSGVVIGHLVRHVVHDIEGTEPISYRTEFYGPSHQERAEAYVKTIGG